MYVIILLVFEKIYSCLFIPNCTRNHVITYTNDKSVMIWLKQKGWNILTFVYSLSSTFQPVTFPSVDSLSLLEASLTIVVSLTSLVFYPMT